MSDDTLNKRVSDLEAEAKRNAERYDRIEHGIERINVALSGDEKNDILGVIGRMKLSDESTKIYRDKVEALINDMIALKQTVANHAIAVAAWNKARDEMTGAVKVGRILYTFLGGVGGVFVFKLFELYQSASIPHVK